MSSSKHHILKEFKRTKLYRIYQQTQLADGSAVSLDELAIKLFMQTKSLWQSDEHYLVLALASLCYYSNYILTTRVKGTLLHLYQPHNSQTLGFYPTITALNSLKSLHLTSVQKTQIVKLVVFSKELVQATDPTTVLTKLDYSEQLLLVKFGHSLNLDLSTLIHTPSSTDHTLNSSIVSTNSTIACLNSTIACANSSIACTKTSSSANLSYNLQITSDKHQLSGSQPQLIFMVGLPRSGKTTYIAQQKNSSFKYFRILSRDDLVMSYATAQQSYADCFQQLTSQQHQAIDQAFTEQFKQALAEHKSIILDRTNLTTAGRHKFLDSTIYPELQHYHKTAIVFCVELEKVIRRNRSDFKLANSLIYRMVTTLKLPTLAEFDQVVYYWE